METEIETATFQTEGAEFIAQRGTYIHKHPLGGFYLSTQRVLTWTEMVGGNRFRRGERIMTHCTDPTGCRSDCSSESVCGIPTCGNHVCMHHAFPIDISTDGEEDWLLVCRSCAEKQAAGEPECSTSPSA